jgi:hypothetical protein
MKPTIVCDACGGKDLKQEAAIMLDPNATVIPGPHDEFVFQDFYWCDTCAEECHPEAIASEGCRQTESDSNPLTGAEYGSLEL